MKNNGVIYGDLIPSVDLAHEFRCSWALGMCSSSFFCGGWMRLHQSWQFKVETKTEDRCNIM